MLWPNQWKERERKPAEHGAPEERPREKNIPVRSSLKTKKLESFIKRLGDLPCKRTCHGKGRQQIQSLTRAP